MSRFFDWLGSDASARFLAGLFFILAIACDLIGDDRRALFDILVAIYWMIAARARTGGTV